MKLKPSNSWLICSALAIITNCGKNDLPKTYTLGKLRILGIQADQPELNPLPSGKDVAITLAVSDVTGAGRALQYQYQTCFDPGIGLGVTPSCANDPTSVKSAPVNFTLPGPVFTGTLPTFSITVPPIVLAKATDIEKYNGVAYLLLVSVTSANGETTQGFRRIIATTRTQLNQNPTLTSLQLDGNPLTSLPAKESIIRPTLGLNTEETYSLKKADGTLVPKTEQLTVSWFITEGEMKYSRTSSDSANTYTPAGSPSNIPHFIYAVIRDDRGGVSFLANPVSQP